MAWTTPKTWASGYVVLAADLNTHLRDNLNVTAPAVMSTAGDIIYASGSNTPARLAKDTNSTRSLTNTGSNNIPAWAQVALATGVSGTLPVGSGGTGATTFTANGILVGNTTSAVAVTATMATKGHLMAGDGSGVPSMLAVGGTDDHVLTVDSGEPTGMKWAAAGAGGNDISVLVFNDANQSIANSSNTILTWDQELFNTDTMHATDDRLTATTAGKYFVFWQVDWASNAAGFREIVIELNGSGTQEYFRGSIPNLNLHAMSGFVLLALSSTDYVRLRVAQNSGGSLNVNLSASDSLKSFFGMVKILG